jgi:hypothetical protein
MAKMSIGILLCLIGGIVMILAGVLAMVNITILWRGLDLTNHGGIISPVFGIIIVISAYMSLKQKKPIWSILIGLMVIANIYLGYDIAFLGNAITILGLALRE